MIQPPVYAALLALLGAAVVGLLWGLSGLVRLGLERITARVRGERGAFAVSTGLLIVLAAPLIIAFWVATLHIISNQHVGKTCVNIPQPGVDLPGCYR